MPDIFLYLEGQQNGPLQIAQIRQLLSEGKISAETPAWYEGLSEWSNVGTVLAAFPPAGESPVAMPPPPPIVASAKKGMNSCLLAALIVGAVGFAGIFVIALLAGVALGPIQNGIKKAKENASMQQSRAIDLAMFAYASDHNGAYPDGNTSTEVFQKLVDGKYVSDPKIFWAFVPGKVPATSDHLTAQNVGFDVTSGINANSPGSVPVVFSTGFNVTYSAGAAPTPDPAAQRAFPGIAVAYKDNSAHFWETHPDGTISPIISSSFAGGAQTYRQLKP